VKTLARAFFVEHDGARFGRRRRTMTEKRKDIAARLKELR